MIYGFRPGPGGLTPVDPAALGEALWIDLYSPLDSQIAAVEALGVEIPTLADMEEIEISNRLYREGDADYMTAVLPGELPDGTRLSMPVTFILTKSRLVTVRHHTPRPFVTFPERAGKSVTGCHTSDRLLVGLTEEIIARQADILEGSGRVLDGITKDVFGGKNRGDPENFQRVLERIGVESEVMAMVRLALLSIERLLAFYTAGTDARPEAGRMKSVAKSQLRDIQALEVHADFLASRVGLTVDATMGMINLQQNNTVRILSVITALFLPPTLIASIYGMNFTHMPELDQPWGYGMALGLMLGSGVATWLLLRWKKWL